MFSLLQNLLGIATGVEQLKPDFTACFVIFFLKLQHGINYPPYWLSGLMML